MGFQALNCKMVKGTMETKLSQTSSKSWTSGIVALDHFNSAYFFDANKARIEE